MERMTEAAGGGRTKTKSLVAVDGPRAADGGGAGGGRTQFSDPHLPTALFTLTP